MRGAALLAALAVAPINADAACRQALAFGLDVSGSVDAREYRLQLDGLATALNSKAVRDALLNGISPPVDIAVFEWSGPTDQTLILPWSTLDHETALSNVTTTLLTHQRAPASQTTAIGSAMLFGTTLLDQRATCWRRTLDLSGDGEANTGPRPQDISTDMIPSDIIINALVIGAGDQRGNDQRQADIKSLSSYFRQTVIRGPDAFVETSVGFEDYAAAMERKILRELLTLTLGGLRDQ